MVDAPPKIYLVNCGDWYSVEKSLDKEGAASQALLKIFEEKKWNISPIVIIWDVEKAFSPPGDLDHMEFLSTEETLRECGLNREAESMACLRDTLYSHLKNQWQKI